MDNFLRKTALLKADRLYRIDAIVKNPKNAAKTIPTLQNQGAKVLLTLASESVYLIGGSIQCIEGLKYRVCLS